jgi:hypothetical protein
MQRIIFIFLILLIAYSYDNFQSKPHNTVLPGETLKQNNFIPTIKDTIIKNDSIPSNIKNELEILKTLNPQWIKYYNININKFKLDKTWQENSLIMGNIVGDFNSKFNKNHSAFLINSPDNSQYIDLDYSSNFQKNDKNELVITGGEVDQEVNWVNRKTKKIKRLFFGGSAWIEDAKWINSNEIVLFGYDSYRKKIFIWLIDLSTLHFKSYYYAITIETKSDFNYDIRLKNIKINYD